MPRSKGSKAPQGKGDSFQHDMRPPAGILNVFSRLNYKPHYAIAEFVDNSTQSYLLHSKELDKSESGYQMHVEITYDPEDKELVVSDNAFGMERDRFLDAITLDAKNDEQIDSRNEFGMGLKTAASWFGNIWSVSSTALGSSYRYEAEVNIPMLQETGENNIDVKVSKAKPEEHGTIIRIQQMTKGMAARSVGKTKDLLASMYRRDLKNGKIRITFNGGEILFNDYQVLTFRGKEWKKPLDFKVEFGGKKYHVTGFVGILAENYGGYPKAGFALFRRNRVIIGGDDQNYKPQKIFIQAQSTIAHKLFGELDMDDFPVNQAKDGFIWDDGLEDEFIETLKSNIQDYINVARLTIKQRADEERFSTDASNRVKNQVQESIERSNQATLEEGDVEEPSHVPDDFALGGEENLEDLIREQLAEGNNQPDTNVGERRIYPVQITPGLIKDISVTWTIGSSQRWIDVKELDGGDAIDITVNINHPFFKPYSNEEEFQIVLEKFVIAFVVAEEQAKFLSQKDGMIPDSAIRANMNKFLARLGD